MPVPTVITDLFSNPAANSPLGTDSPNVLDDHQRALGAFVRQLYDVVCGGGGGTLSTLFGSVGVSAGGRIGVTPSTDTAVAGGVTFVKNGLTVGGTYSGDTAPGTIVSGTGGLRFATAGVIALAINASGNSTFSGTGDTALNVTSSAAAFSTALTLASSAAGSSSIIASQNLIFTVTSVERMRLSGNGSVGINGTPDANNRLHINPASGNASGLHVGTLDQGLTLWQSTGNDPAIIYGSASTLRLGTQTAFGATGFYETFRIDASGNVTQIVTTAGPTLSRNSTMGLALTSNTNLRFSVRGTDGVTRTANLTLA